MGCYNHGADPGRVPATATGEAAKARVAAGGGATGLPPGALVGHARDPAGGMARARRWAVRVVIQQALGAHYRHG